MNEIVVLFRTKRLESHFSSNPWWMGKTKYWIAFERGMVVGARHTVYVCIKNCPPPKRQPDNFTQLWEASVSTWASIPAEHFRHLVESMSDELRLFWMQNGVQLSTRKVFLMFGTLSVYLRCTGTIDRHTHGDTPCIPPILFAPDLLSFFNVCIVHIPFLMTPKKEGEAGYKTASPHGQSML